MVLSVDTLPNMEIKSFLSPCLHAYVKMQRLLLLFTICKTLWILEFGLENGEEPYI